MRLWEEENKTCNVTQFQGYYFIFVRFHTLNINWIFRHIPGDFFNCEICCVDIILTLDFSPIFCLENIHNNYHSPLKKYGAYLKFSFYCNTYILRNCWRTSMEIKRFNARHDFGIWKLCQGNFSCRKKLFNSQIWICKLSCYINNYFDCFYNITELSCSEQNRWNCNIMEWGVVLQPLSFFWCSNLSNNYISKIK